MMHCADCRKPIVETDDDAGVCVHCGGYNRRMSEWGPEARWLDVLFWVLIATAVIAVCTTL